MADEDEDLEGLRGPNPTEAIDLSEETQDFRFLNQLTASNLTGHLSLPKRGEKDFESHATDLQLSHLEASRQAMHGVLSWTRVHTPRAHMLGVYHPESNMAYVENAKGVSFQTMGRQKGRRTWLLPEEALFMIERGSLDCRWPVPEEAENHNEDGEEEARETKIEDGVPMSLQAAYAAFIGFEEGVGGKLTQEMYTVYAGLKRSGYIVFRHGSWNEDRAELDLSTVDTQKESRGLWVGSFLSELWRRLSSSSVRVTTQQLQFGPLVKPGLYRNYADIYRLLKLIPTHDHAAPPNFMLPPDASNPYRLTFDVWKQAGKFRKAQRPPPDFRFAVINARETGLPTAAQVNDLLATTPYDPPKPDRPLYQKLKHGTRNVILAVVDNGVPSFLRIGDAPFADERIYERENAPRGGKYGGRGGGRGRGGQRGRGRGRGGRGG
ncbi:tRNA-splicing endonuclease subunit sen54 N-term-domain-containing protein [Lophiotrema nucula]|uniref:tRNA-splicing endonuclease subunit sen54 N-term-domain-containing protein n=1 Tax=Lophiotrema nucula TaxID=690887 RepID=A0A6A5ZQG0_9PLEO|nr:tRNA-splicing endonuclease subunit sen54 N-term-domain-containing protein [Lophiotrema nucula]